jgi:hypothetical protein
MIESRMGRRYHTLKQKGRGGLGTSKATFDSGPFFDAFGSGRLQCQVGFVDLDDFEYLRRVRAEGESQGIAVEHPSASCGEIAVF